MFCAALGPLRGSVGAFANTLRLLWMVRLAEDIGSLLASFGDTGTLVTYSLTLWRVVAFSNDG